MIILRHRRPGGWLRSLKDRFEGPQSSIAHNLAGTIFHLQERCGRPARRQTRWVRLRPISDEGVDSKTRTKSPFLSLSRQRPTLQLRKRARTAPERVAWFGLPNCPFQ
jgi:hypothetical protein